MINSIKSTYSQLEELEKYINANTQRLFITTDIYTALMDIRERLKREISQYELQQRKLKSSYADELKKRSNVYKRIQKKQIKAESLSLIHI